MPELGGGPLLSPTPSNAILGSGVVGGIAYFVTDTKHITSVANFSYDDTFPAVWFGGDRDYMIANSQNPTAETAGNKLILRAGNANGTDQVGGMLELRPGRGTGSGYTEIDFMMADPNTGSGPTDLNPLYTGAVLGYDGFGVARHFIYFQNYVTDGTFMVDSQYTNDANGNPLNVRGGDAGTGGIDHNGGDVHIQSGRSTGTGVSSIVFEAPLQGVSGNTVNDWDQALVMASQYRVISSGNQWNIVLNSFSDDTVDNNLSFYKDRSAGASPNLQGNEAIGEIQWRATINGTYESDLGMIRGVYVGDGTTKLTQVEFYTNNGTTLEKMMTLTPYDEIEVTAQLLQFNNFVTASGGPVIRFNRMFDSGAPITAGAILGETEYYGNVNGSDMELGKIQAYYGGDGTTRSGAFRFWITTEASGGLPQPAMYIVDNGIPEISIPNGLIFSTSYDDSRNPVYWTVRTRTGGTAIQTGDILSELRFRGNINSSYLDAIDVQAVYTGDNTTSDAALDVFMLPGGVNTRIMRVDSNNNLIVGQHTTAMAGSNHIVGGVAHIITGTGNFVLSTVSNTAVQASNNFVMGGDIQVGNFGSIFAFGNNLSAGGQFDFTFGYFNVLGNSSYDFVYGNNNTINGTSQHHNTAIGSANSVIGTGVQYATMIGNTNEVDKSYGFVKGLGGRAMSYGENVQAGGYFANPGDAQAAKYVLRKQTTDDTVTELALDGGTEYIQTADNHTYRLNIVVIGRVVGSSDIVYLYATGMVSRDSGFATTNVSWALNPFDWTDTGVLAGAHNNITLTVDTATDGHIKISVKGVAATTVNWVGVIDTVEVGV